MSTVTPEPKKRFGKGILLICIGSTLLLHTFGLFQHILTVLIIVVSLGMVAYGMVLTNAYTAIMQFCTYVYNRFQSK